MIPKCLPAMLAIMRTLAAMLMLAVIAYAIPARADATIDAIVAAGVTDARHDYAHWVRKAADQGNAGAQVELGSMYEIGQGVPKDEAEAVRWMRKAADQGDAHAQTILGAWYTYGICVPQDYAEAVRWYRKAADQGYADAQLELGDVYADGDIILGIPKDDAERHRWYRTEQGDAHLPIWIASMYNRQGVPKDDTEAARWYRKAAEQGKALAQTILGVMYAAGQGVPKDYVQAYMWFNLAAGGENAGGENDAAKRRDSLERSMTAEQIAEAQKRTAAWRPISSAK
jgi:TPR repeat protein